MLNTELLHDPARHIHKRNENLWLYKNLYLNVEALFRITKKIETIQMVINWWEDNVVYSYSGILYLATTKKWSTDILYIVAWMNLENIMLMKRNQVQKTTYFMIPLIQSVQNRQVQKNRKQISGCQMLGRGKWGINANVYRVSFWGWQKSCDGFTTVNTPETAELYTLKGWIVCYVNYISIKLLFKKIINPSRYTPDFPPSCSFPSLFLISLPFTHHSTFHHLE